MSQTIAAQQERMLKALQAGPLTSLEAVRDLDILRAAARVHELREMGHPILTHWSIDQINGKRHRVARYVMLAGDHDA